MLASKLRPGVRPLAPRRRSVLVHARHSEKPSPLGRRGLLLGGLTLLLGAPRPSEARSEVGCPVGGAAQNGRKPCAATGFAALPRGSLGRPSLLGYPCVVVAGWARGGSLSFRLSHHLQASPSRKGFNPTADVATPDVSNGPGAAQTAAAAAGGPLGTLVTVAAGGLAAFFGIQMNQQVGWWAWPRWGNLEARERDPSC